MTGVDRFCGTGGHLRQPPEAKRAPRKWVCRRGLEPVAASVVAGSGRGDGTCPLR